MRTAIVVFTKVPKVGETKTRLTTERDGILSQEEAKSLYEGCLLDAVNCCTAAESGDVLICYNQGGDRGSLEELLVRLAEPHKIKGLFCDRGGSFDACMQFAGDYILKNEKNPRRYDAIVIVGGDLPTLQPAHVRNSVRKLEKLSAGSAGMAAAIVAGEPVGAAIVEGACQEGGFSIIGYTYNTPFEFDKVFYNMDGITALDMVVEKAREKNVPFACVDMVPDVDIPLDLASMIPVVKSLQLAACYDSEILPPVNTLKVLQELALEATAPPPQR